jgi:hypothetical protein
VALGIMIIIISICTVVITLGGSVGKYGRETVAYFLEKA